MTVVFKSKDGADITLEVQSVVIRANTAEFAMGLLGVHALYWQASHVWSLSIDDHKGEFTGFEVKP